MLKIAICDDDLGFTGSLENLVLEESQRMGIRVNTDVFSDEIGRASCRERV